jgi:K+-sensing histidine kinase KdpD
VLPPYLLLTALGAGALLLGVWWLRSLRIEAQRRSMYAFHKLSEEIIAAGSAEEIAEKLSTVLPGITQATSVQLYLYNRRSKCLERVPTTSEPQPMAIPLEGSADSPPAGPLACYRSRKMLSLPEVPRNPLSKPNAKSVTPRSALLVPLLAQNDVMGVLQAGNAKRAGYFSLDEQAAAQHLANQVAAALKLQEQQSMREQLFQSEKLAATGQLISGVANELRAPLESITELTASLISLGGRLVPDRDLRLLAAESRRASEIVSRLVSFARPEDADARLVDVNALVSSLMKFREPEWKTMGLRVQNRLSPECAQVLGVEGQLEQVILNLLVHAEQCIGDTPSNTLSIASSTIAGRVLVEITYSTSLHTIEADEPELDPHDAPQIPEHNALGLAVCQGLIQSHGGELRFRTRASSAGFEVDLPLARLPGNGAAAASGNGGGEDAKPARQLTLMLVDPNGQQHQLLGLLGARRHRVVPVAAEEVVELAQRLKFDAVIWCTRNAGLRWSDVHERIRQHVPGFVFIGEAYDSELAKDLDENGAFFLARPIQEPELDRILRAAETRAPTAQPKR